MIEQAMIAETGIIASEQRTRSRHVSTQVMLAGLIGDTLVVFLALAFSSWLRFETALAHVGVNPNSVHWTDYFGHAALGALLFVILLPHRQMYDLHRILHFRQIVSVIFRTALTWLLTYMAVSWLLRSDQETSRIYVVIAFTGIRAISKRCTSWSILGPDSEIG